MVMSSIYWKTDEEVVITEERVACSVNYYAKF